jgi:hypothetical protein
MQFAQLEKFAVFKVVGGEVNSACNALADETQAAYDDTLRYTEVINFEYRRPGSITAPAARLQDELAHRRQYMAYLRQLQAESLEVSSMIEQTSQTFDDQMNLFKKLIGDRPSVPKEEVYPRFQMFARLWIAVSEERDKSAVRRNVYSELRGARDAFKVALTEHDLNLALRSPPNDADDAYMQAEAVAADQLQSVPLSDGLDTALASDPTHALFTRVTRLSAQSAPDLFMQLPMEFQGFCAWSIVHRSCLLPGNPSVGLLRYRGKYYSFAEAAGMAAFVADPEKYVRGVLAEAQRHPELIHLVRLQDSLPHTAIAGFIEGYGQHPDFKSLFGMLCVLPPLFAYQMSNSCCFVQMINQSCASTPAPRHRRTLWSVTSTSTTTGTSGRCARKRCSWPICATKRPRRFRPTCHTFVATRRHRRTCRRRSPTARCRARAP